MMSQVRQSRHYLKLLEAGVPHAYVDTGFCDSNKVDAALLAECKNANSSTRRVATESSIHFFGDTEDIRRQFFVYSKLFVISNHKTFIASARNLRYSLKKDYVTEDLDYYTRCDVLFIHSVLPSDENLLSFLYDRVVRGKLTFVWSPKSRSLFLNGLKLNKKEILYNFFSNSESIDGDFFRKLQISATN